MFKHERQACKLVNSLGSSGCRHPVAGGAASVFEARGPQGPGTCSTEVILYYGHSRYYAYCSDSKCECTIVSNIGKIGGKL